MSKLRISEELSLPLDAVTQTFALLAVRGAGKSNAAAAMAEEMFAAGLPFVVIDPVSSWYGLRAGIDGRPGGGLSIPIFGGKHGDLPLERGAGQFVANLIVDKRLTCVLDLGDFKSEGDKKIFLLDFARRIYQKNEDPLHLFLEEADDYIPQRPMRDEAQLLRAWENIVRRGRARGLGMTMITQRSAAVAKMVLTQVETLFVLRTTGPQDIAAIEAWVKYHQVDKTLLASLAGLEDGEAWVWSPHYLKKIERFRFRRRQTFDSGATPKNLRGKDGRKAATLADVDLDRLRTEMSATIEKVKADDPKELRRRIAELEREMAKKAAPSKPERVEVPIFDDAAWIKLKADIEQDIMLALNNARGALHAYKSKCYESATRARKESPPAAGGPVMGSDRGERVPARSSVAGVARGNPPRAASSSSDDVKIGKGELATLKAIAQHQNGATSQQLSILTGYRRSTRDAYLQRLRSAELIEDVGDFHVATQAGIDALGRDFEPLPTGAALREHWLRELPDGQRKILAILIEAYPSAVPREKLDEETSYARSSRDAYLQRLSARKLITGKRGQPVMAAKELFE